MSALPLETLQRHVDDGRGPTVESEIHAPGAGERAGQYGLQRDAPRFPEMQIPKMLPAMAFDQGLRMSNAHTELALMSKKVKR
jgi:hypothetical protein